VVGRKRRRRERERRRDERTPQDGAAGAATPAEEPSWRLPSPLARIGGFGLAVATVVIATVVTISAFADGVSAVDAGVRLFAGAFLYVLAVLLATLAIAPLFVRRFIVRD
jgi:hypothetical protein